MEGGLKKLPLCYIANSMWSACTDGAHDPTIISNRIGSFSPRLSHIVPLRVGRPWLVGKIVVLHARQVTASGTGSMENLPIGAGGCSRCSEPSKSYNFSRLPRTPRNVLSRLLQIQAISTDAIRERAL